MAVESRNNPNLIEQAGDFNLVTANILSYRKNQEDGILYEMDIKPSIVTMEITEDIFTNALVGNIVVYDSQDIRTVLPITGLEKLELAFHTPGMPGLNAVREEGFPLHIYKIEGIAQDEINAQAQYYKIFFTSSEAYYNSFNRVSQAFTGPIEDSIETILRSKDYLNSKKKLFIEPTKTNTKFVIPNLKPFSAINFLSQSAIAGLYNNAGYLFYETFYGYHFRSIESLLALGGAVARPSKFKYNYQIANTPGEVKDVANDLKNVIAYDFERPANVLYNINEGMYANRLILHDSFYKTVHTYDFDYMSSFGDYFHTEHEDGNKSKTKTTLPLTKFEDTDKDFGQQANAKLMVYCDNQKIHNDYEFPPLKDTVQNALSQRLQLRNVNLSLHVYGNTLLHAGDIINFDLPLMRPVSGTNVQQRSNPQWSGRYLIMAIKHTISIPDNRHEMTLKCMKDAVRNDYAIELTNTTVETKELSKKVDTIYNLDQEFLKSDLLEGIE